MEGAGGIEVTDGIKVTDGIEGAKSGMEFTEGGIEVTEKIKVTDGFCGSYYLEELSGFLSLASFKEAAVVA